MKKKVALTLLAAFGLVLTACGGGSDPTETPSVDPTETPTETPTENPSEDPTETPFVAPEYISLIGSMEESGWSNDIDLTSEDGGHTWVIEDYPLYADVMWKIRKDHKWDVDWTFEDLDETSKALFEDCPSDNHNIKVVVSAYYTITFDYDNEVISAVQGETISSMDHLPPLVKDLPEGSITRKYNSQFDKMLDDFSGDTLTGVSQKTVEHVAKPALRVLVDSANGDFPGSEDASIYKMATGTTAIETYEGIGFRIRKVGEGSLSLNNLVLALRGDDAYNVYPISFADAVNVDGDALPELTDEYQEYVVCPMLSIEDANTEYELRDGSGLSGVKVLDKILGFHLYATGECSQLIEIEEVYVTNPGDVKTLDSFNRELVNKTDETCWWRDSTGFIVRKGAKIHTDGFYMPITVDLYANWENIVLTVNGSTLGTGLYFFNASGTLVSNAAWWDLKDPEGNPAPNAVDGAYHSIVINFAQSNLDMTGVCAVSIGSISQLYVSEIFLSNLQEKAAATDYPRLGSDFVYFDDFNREMANVASTYETGNSDVDSKIADAGLYYSVSYHGSEKTSVNGDALVIQPTESNDYVQVTEGSTRGRTNQKYMVFAMKLEGEGDLSGLRVATSQSSALYSPNWVAGPGLPSVPADPTSYSYVKDGYTWYIMDLEECDFIVADAMDIYYTGTATLYIDAIFFADEYFEISYGNTYEDDPLTTVDFSESYKYFWGNVNTYSDTYLEFEISGDGTVSFDSLRVAVNASMSWAKDDQLVIVDTKFNPIDVNAPIPTDPTTYAIDLVASGLDIDAVDTHFHWGDQAECTKGVVQIAVRGYFSKVSTFTEIINQTPASITYSTDATGYGYGYMGYNNGGLEYILLVFVGDDVATLGSFRLEYAGKTVFATEKAWIYDLGFQPADLSAPISSEGSLFVLDLVAAGFDTSVAGDMHMHFGQNADFPGGTIYFAGSTGLAMKAPYRVALNAYNA